MRKGLNGKKTATEDPVQAMDRARNIVREKCEREIKAILDKYKCEIGARAVIDADGRGGAATILRLKDN